MEQAYTPVSIQHRKNEPDSRKGLTKIMAMSTWSLDFENHAIDKPNWAGLRGCRSFRGGTVIQIRPRRTKICEKMQQIQSRARCYCCLGI
jgi:hypothetical protein